jgi:hypothetical protein
VPTLTVTLNGHLVPSRVAFRWRSPSLARTCASPLQLGIVTPTHTG